MATFKNPNDPDNIIIRDKIKEWLQLYFKIAFVDVYSIEEVPCPDLACPDIFTKILCKYKTDPQEFQIQKPLTFVRKIDIKALYEIYG